MDLEAQRLENVRNKQKLLAQLNLQASSALKVNTDEGESRTGRGSRSIKRRKLETSVEPVRKSARTSGARPNYNENISETRNYVEAKAKTKKVTRRTATTEPQLDTTPNDARNLVPVTDADAIRAGWTDWKPTGSPATRDDNGTFHFDDYPKFTPNKSPEEMLREGCFGGSYFRPLKSRRLGVLVEGDWKELPEAWYDGLDIEKFMVSMEYDPEVNKYKVSCGQSIEEWEAAGWISHEHDVRGWFQWYCRFWMGRRCDDDDRQIGRWDRCVGKKGRWRRVLLKKYVKMGVREVFDYGDEDDKGEVSPVMHQTCHHWACEIRQGDLDEAWEEFG